MMVRRAGPHMFPPIEENSMDTQDLSSRATSPAAMEESAPLARRAVLRAGAVVPVGVGLTSLAACGNDSSSESATSQADADLDGERSEETGADTEADAGAEDGAETTEFPAADVPVGGATYDEATNTVFSQPAQGEFRAFDATCPHQGCAVSEFSEGSLLCPCHSSMFDPDTGDVISGPATTGLTTRNVTVQGDDLVVG